MRIWSCLLLLFALNTHLLAQQAPLSSVEDSLYKQLENIRNEKNIESQDSLNALFVEHLKKVLEEYDVFTYSFPQLSKVMSTITSPDNQFRIFNWNVEFGQHEEQKYYCFILNKDPKTNGYKIIELKDRSATTSNVETAQLTEKNWFGCLYYKIIPLDKGGTTLYTLLGWDGHDMVSTKKLIETMVFNGVSKVKFGLPVFQIEDDKSKRRVVFQYSSQTTMSLKYQFVDKKHVLIFDHLSPQAPHLHEFKEWYVPDGSFDSFVWQNGKWVYEKDVDARSGKKFKTKYNDPRGNTP
jgi:hypothetical protein